jgi:hypothetical protein
MELSESLVGTGILPNFTAVGLLKKTNLLCFAKERRNSKGSTSMLS